MKYGDELELSIEKLAFEGKAIAHAGELVVFVEGALPGDTARVKIIKKKKNFAEARAIEILSPSPDRISPQCMHFGACGGCKWQHLAYTAQCEWKRTHVAESFEHIGELHSIPVLPTIPCAQQFYYRNKMEFSFSTSRWRVENDINEKNDDGFTLGLHVPNNYAKVLHIEQCLLQSENSNLVLRSVRNFIRANGLTVYNNKLHEGYLRFLTIRDSKKTGDMMVNIVTSEDKPDIMEMFTQHLVKECPFITTVVNNINTRLAQIAFGESEKVYVGEGFIRERIGVLEFVISANSFFQTNTKQAEILYSTAKDFGDFRREDVVWDLYCGTGTIAMYVADAVQKVIGVEQTASAIADAKRNAEHNKISNVEFICGDVKETLLQSKSGVQHINFPDCVIIDPPRSGMHPDVVKELLNVAPERIVYVSCNPATQARDLKILSEKYAIEKVQPVDMFPHTYHIEAVAKLTKKS